jgi:CBS domain-containing protein
MQCKEAMKAPVKTCSKKTPVAECAKLMVEHNIGFIPVVDDQNELAGVVTDRDLAVRVLGKDRSSQTSVSDVMTTEVVTCSADDGLTFAEKQLRDARKSRIVVVDSARHVIGVLSLSDIGRIEDPERAGQVLRGVTRREATGVIGARK